MTIKLIRFEEIDFRFWHISS